MTKAQRQSAAKSYWADPRTARRTKVRSARNSAWEPNRAYFSARCAESTKRSSRALYLSTSAESVLLSSCSYIRRARSLRLKSSTSRQRLGSMLKAHSLQEVGHSVDHPFADPLELIPN